MSRHRGTFKHGQTRTTPDQRKKHITQMSGDEISFILTLVKNNNRPVKLSRHLVDKISQGELTLNLGDVLHEIECLSADNIIEFNTREYGVGKISDRILVRSNKTSIVSVNGKQEKCNLCFSIDIDTMIVVTAYWNRVSDTHRSVDWSRYDEYLDPKHRLNRV